MGSELPSVAELKRAVENGQEITAEDASYIGQRERELTGGSLVTGGPAATAHNLVVRRMNFNAKLDEISRKPQSHITPDDAREIYEAEGRAFNKSPGPGSISAQVRSMADRNESLGLLAHSTADPVYITKADASEAQHMESLVYGGQNPAGGMAAQMQSAADKLEHAREGDNWF